MGTLFMELLVLGVGIYVGWSYKSKIKQSLKEKLSDFMAYFKS